MPWYVNFCYTHIGEQRCYKIRQHKLLHHKHQHVTLWLRLWMLLFLFTALTVDVTASPSPQHLSFTCFHFLSVFIASSVFAIMSSSVWQPAFVPDSLLWVGTIKVPSVIMPASGSNVFFLLEKLDELKWSRSHRREGKAQLGMRTLCIYLYIFVIFPYCNWSSIWFLFRSILVMLLLNGNHLSVVCTCTCKRVCVYFHFCLGWCL